VLTLLSKRRTADGIWRSTVALTTVACLTGCVASPASSRSGLERQVVDGERLSAATHLRLAPQRAGLAASPGPVAARSASGRQVTAIGDSVMAASAGALEARLPGIYIDAVPSRQMPAGLEVLRRLVASGQLRPVVVVGLGTNYIVTTSELSQLVRLIGPGRRLVLINTYVPDDWSKEVNATMASFIRSHPTVVLADWYDKIRHRTNLLWPDQVHPELPGTAVYARMVYRAVHASLDAAGAPAGCRV
jgi:hypothetical protein